MVPYLFNGWMSLTLQGILSSQRSRVGLVPLDGNKNLRQILRLQLGEYLDLLSRTHVGKHCRVGTGHEEERMVREFI